jgi:hypothetical protein
MYLSPYNLLPGLKIMTGKIGYTPFPTADAFSGTDTAIKCLTKFLTLRNLRWKVGERKEMQKLQSWILRSTIMLDDRSAEGRFLPHSLS